MISGGRSGAGGILVPVQRFEIVAHELLVETRRADAGFVGGHRPEARRIRRQHFVDQDQIAGLVGAELELGVRDDDVARAGMRGGEDVERQRDPADALGVLASDRLDDGGEVDVLIVLAGGRLRCRREQRLRQCVRHLQARRQGDAAHGTPRHVILVARTDQIPPGDGLDRQCVQLPHHHGAAGERGALVAVRNEILDPELGQLIRDDVPGLVEPELGDPCEHCALEGYRIGQHHIEGRQPIRGDDEHMVRVDVIDVAYLALVDLFQASDSTLEQRRRLRKRFHASGLLPLWVGRSAIVAGRVG